MDGRVKIEIDRWRTFSKLWQMICAEGVPNEAATRITNLPELIIQMKQNKTKQKLQKEASIPSHCTRRTPGARMLA